ncbi:MAG: alpha/beta hydrolase [Clostridia bacterium]|nr:alpha/beta hydrolase [Clostridia bacterium]
MVERFKITIPQLTGEKERTAFVYLPTGYDMEEDRKYPVLYMFDGHNLFTDEEATYGKCWGLEDYLDYTDTQIIVAAVECNTEGNGRLSEYSPVDFPWQGGGIIKGRGRLYMNWLVKDFKPYIDTFYRTLPDRKNTAIAGSSMGGLMTMYALAKYGAVFSKGAALSPSLWVGDGKAVRIIEDAYYRRGTILYTDYGSQEFRNHTGQMELFADTCATLMKNGVQITARIVPGGTHCEASWEKQIPIFMQVLGFLSEH